MTIWLGIVYAYKGLLMVGVELQAQWGRYIAGRAPSPRGLRHHKSKRKPQDQARAFCHSQCPARPSSVPHERGTNSIPPSLVRTLRLGSPQVTELVVGGRMSPRPVGAPPGCHRPAPTAVC